MKESRSDFKILTGEPTVKIPSGRPTGRRTILERILKK
jgi:hypothetical protein